MSKVQASIMLSFNDLNTLRAVQTQYHLKTLGHSVELVLHQWERFIEERTKIQKAIQKEKKPVNPLVNP